MSASTNQENTRDESDYPDGFVSRMSFPPHWRIRHRNLRIWRAPDAGAWLMEPLPDEALGNSWTEMTFGGAEPATVFYRGPIDFMFRVGSTEIEPRPASRKVTGMVFGGAIAEPQGDEGYFVDEQTIRLRTGY